MNEPENKEIIVSFPVFVKVLELFQLVIVLDGIRETLESHGFHLYYFAHVAYHFDQRVRDVLGLLADAVDKFQHAKVHLSPFMVEILTELLITDCYFFLIHGFGFEYPIGADQGPHDGRVFLNDHLPELCGQDVLTFTCDDENIA